MDSFSLLKFWKGGAATSSSTVSSPSPPPPPTTTTSDSEPDAGPFFDLEFSLPSDDEDQNKENDEEEEEEVVNLTNDDDDVYIRGQIVEINGSDEVEDIVGTTKSGHFPIPVSLLRSATKLRVLMLGLRKSKEESTSKSTSKSKEENKGKKMLRVKLRMKGVENPIITLLTRNSSNLNQNTTKEEKKEKLHKYLRVFYDKLNIKKDTAVVHSMPPMVVSNNTNTNIINNNNINININKNNNNNNGGVSVRSGGKRKDDSLFQVQDGIQAAILHCKRSFNSSTALEELEVEPSVVGRDPSTAEETVAAASEDDGRNVIVGI